MKRLGRSGDVAFREFDPGVKLHSSGSPKPERHFGCRIVVTQSGKRNRRQRWSNPVIRPVRIVLALVTVADMERLLGLLRNTRSDIAHIAPEPHSIRDRL